MPRLEARTVIVQAACSEKRSLRPLCVLRDAPLGLLSMRKSGTLVAQSDRIALRRQRQVRIASLTLAMTLK